MPLHDVGPLYAKIHYHVGDHQHQMMLSLKYSGLPTSTPAVGVDPILKSKVDTDVYSADVIGDLVTALKFFYTTGDGFDSYDLWWKASPVATPLWIYGQGIESGTGSAASGTVVASQCSMSFRTLSGNRFRLQFMESRQAVNLVLSAADIIGDSNQNALKSAVSGDGSAIIGRDGAYIGAVIRLVSKTNDKLRHRYLV